MQAEAESHGFDEAATRWVTLLLQADATLPAPTARAMVARVRELPIGSELARLDTGRTVIHGLATLGIGCVRLDDEGLLEMVAGFYHPSLPMLHIPPKQQLRPLIMGGEVPMGHSITLTIIYRTNASLMD